MTTRMTTALMLVAGLGLAACTDPGRIGGFGRADDPGAAGFGPGADGALGSPSDPTSVAYFNASVGDRVFFVVDQHDLTPASQAVLDGQAAWLAANPDYTAIIEGHADEQGTRDYNIALGDRRATSVQTYLVSRGVAASRLRVISYGKERPVEICSDEACYAQNRRAVTVLSAGGAGF